MTEGIQTPDIWRRDLKAAGWTEESPTTWRAPDGSLHRGPYGAWRRIRRHEMTSERWEELQAALERPEGPTEAEAEEVLQHYGTSGREVVNGFIERLLSERSSLRSAAQVALHCLQGTGEKTIDQVKVQLRAALKVDA